FESGGEGRRIARLRRDADSLSPRWPAALIKKHQHFRWELARVLSPGGPLLLVALPRLQRLFFRVQPSQMCAPLMVFRFTHSPWVCSQRSQCCTSLASSWACNWGTTPVSTCTRFFGGRPGIALGRICPLSRRCFVYCLMVASDRKTPDVSFERIADQ